MDQLNFVSSTFNISEVYARATGKDRTLMSAQVRNIYLYIMHYLLQESKIEVFGVFRDRISDFGQAFNNILFHIELYAWNVPAGYRPQRINSERISVAVLYSTRANPCRDTESRYFIARVQKLSEVRKLSITLIL